MDKTFDEIMDDVINERFEKTEIKSEFDKIMERIINNYKPLEDENKPVLGVRNVEHI